MKIVIATPLYPPDIAEPAPYIKTLASKLIAQHHVTVVLYGRLPEEVPGVRYVCIDKHTLLFVRLVQCTRALIHEARHADILFVENGASIELPMIVASFFTRTPIIFHIGDKSAHTHTHKQSLRKYIELSLRRRARTTIEEALVVRPEILPFVPYPEQAFAEYNASWKKHLEHLDSIFAHARK